MEIRTILIPTTCMPAYKITLGSDLGEATYVG
jgi:hypothetical protein